MNAPEPSRNRERIRVLIAAHGPSSARLASVLAGPHVDVVAVADLDVDVVDRLQDLDVDVLVMAGGTRMELARTIAEQVSARSSRVTVMIVDDPTSTTDTTVFWPKDRNGRVASAAAPSLPFIAA